MNLLDLCVFRVGDVVRWKADGMLGTVIDKEGTLFRVKWDDGARSTYFAGRISDLGYLDCLGTPSERANAC